MAFQTAITRRLFDPFPADAGNPRAYEYDGKAQQALCMEIAVRRLKMDREHLESDKCGKWSHFATIPYVKLCTIKWHQ